MTWDQLRADLARALDAHFPDEAQAILAGIERRVPGVIPGDPAGLGDTKKVFLSELATAVGDCFPERGDRILHKLQRILEPVEARGDVTRVVAGTPLAWTGRIPTLVIAGGASFGRSLALDRDLLTIGRASNCDLVIEDSTFSRRHLEVRVENGAVTVSDQRSTNGTWINGIPIPPLADVPLS